MSMTSRQRVLTALSRQEPDRVPWVENHVSNEVARALIQKDDFLLSGYSPTKQTRRPVILVPPELCEVLPLDSFSIRFSAPRYIITKMMHTGASRREVSVDGRIKTREDIKILDLPDPDEAAIYKELEEILQRFGKDLARMICISPCVANTALSMGIPHFLATLVEQPGLVQELMNRYADWSIRVIRNLQELPFDLLWVGDDLAFSGGPMMTPGQFRRIIFPIMERVASEIRKPWIFHSDGNLMPILDDLLLLGMNGLANIEPGPMDIEALKRDYGHRICLVGNIDLHYTLTHGTPEETMEEVRRRIAACGPGGGYILASANSLPDYVKPENVVAMGKALLHYGRYPLEVGSVPAPASSKLAATSPQKPPLKVVNAFHALYNAILQGNGDLAEREAGSIVRTGGSAQEVVDQCLLPSMEELGRRSETGIIYLSEMIMAAKAATRALEVLRPHFNRTGEMQGITIVMGTVKNDVHDIGKNIVCTIFEGAGFRVVDLGIDVPAERFIAAIEESGAQAVGLSALLSPSLIRMREIVKKIQEAFSEKHPLILVGGAPVTGEFAHSIGADFRGVSGSDAVAFIRKKLKDPQNV